MQIDTLLSRLSRQTVTLPTRFKVDLSIENAEKALRECYKAEMTLKRVVPTIDKTNESRLAKVAKWLTTDAKSGLLLYGSMGSGKTTMAEAIVRLINTMHFSSLSSQCKSVAKVSAIELVRLCRASTDEEEQAQNQYRYNHYQNAEMLFIDDLGAEDVSIMAWGSRITPVIDLLYSRYDKRLFTIITSNLDENGISERYNARVGDRFKEMFNRIAYTENSYRK